MQKRMRKEEGIHAQGVKFNQTKLIVLLHKRQNGTRLLDYLPYNPVPASSHCSQEAQY